MVKKIGVFLVLLFCVVTSFAQNIVVKGVLKRRRYQRRIDASYCATVALVTVHLWAVSISDEQGLFQLSAPSEGKYLIKISNIGYLSHYQKIDVSAKTPLMLAQL